MLSRPFLLLGFSLCSVCSLKAQAYVEDFLLPAYEFYNQRIGYTPFITQLGLERGELDSVLLSADDGSELQSLVARYYRTPDSAGVVVEESFRGSLQSRSEVSMEVSDDPNATLKFRFTNDFDPTTPGPTSFQTGEVHQSGGRRDSVLTQDYEIDNDGLSVLTITRHDRFLYATDGFVAKSRHTLTFAGSSPYRYSTDYERDQDGNLIRVSTYDGDTYTIEGETDRVSQAITRSGVRTYSTYSISDGQAELYDVFRFYNTPDSFFYDQLDGDSTYFIRVDAEENPKRFKYAFRFPELFGTYTYYYSTLVSSLAETVLLPAKVRIPNPISAGSTLSLLDVPAGARYRLLASSGQTVAAGAATIGQHLEWPSTSAGIYYLVIDAPNFASRGWTIIAQ